MLTDFKNPSVAHSVNTELELRETWVESSRFKTTYVRRFHDLLIRFGQNDVGNSTVEAFSCKLVFIEAFERIRDDSKSIGKEWQYAGANVHAHRQKLFECMNETVTDATVRRSSISHHPTSIFHSSCSFSLPPFSFRTNCTLVGPQMRE